MLPMARRPRAWRKTQADRHCWAIVCGAPRVTLRAGSGANSGFTITVVALVALSRLGATEGSLAGTAPRPDSWSKTARAAGAGGEVVAVGGCRGWVGTGLGGGGTPRSGSIAESLASRCTGRSAARNVERSPLVVLDRFIRFFQLVAAPCFGFLPDSTACCSRRNLADSVCHRYLM